MQHSALVPRGPAIRVVNPARLEVRVHASVAEVDRSDWQRLLPGEPESWDYYRVVEQAPPPNFQLGAISVHRNGEIVAAAPLFRVAYRIDTPLQGALRVAGQWVFERFPRLVSLPVLGVGSPSSDTCSIGFAPELDADQRNAVFSALLAKLEEIAETEKSALVAIKSIDDSVDALEPALLARRFRKVTSVPLVMLDLQPFATFDDYMASLPAKTRGYFKRKLRAATKVRSEYVTSLAGLEAQVFDLFQGTLGQSKVDYGDFEQLTPGYFSRVMDTLGEGVQCQLWWHGDELVGFQMSLVGEKRIVTKHIGMKYPQARELNLYFLAWLDISGSRYRAAFP